MDYTLIIITCLVAFWGSTVTGLKTGELCRLNNGDIGLCRPLSQCTIAVEKAFQGEKPTVCNFDSDVLSVCCGESVHIEVQPAINNAHHAMITRQKPNQSYFGPANQYYIIENGPAERPTMPREYYRYTRGDKPWWLVDKPFVETPPSSTTEIPHYINNNNNYNNNNNNYNNNNNNNRPNRPSAGEPTDDHWWISERPFSSGSQQPPQSPPSRQTPRHTPPPTTRHTPPPTTRHTPPPATRHTPPPTTRHTPPPTRHTPPPTRDTPPPPRQTPPPLTKPPQTPVRGPGSSSGRQRISEIKCDEYSSLVTQQVAALPLVPAPEPVRIDIPKCDFSSLQLIVGGEETKPKEFPHMTALGYKDGGNIEWRCGGSLISDYYVLTAAHCTPKNNPPIVARLGELNLRRNDDGAAPVNYAVVEIKRHPDYKPPAKYNDIALLKLDRRVQFSQYIRPACLYTRNTFEVNKTIATGWGKIDFAENPSDVLLKVAISIIENKVCNQLYELDGVTRELSKGIISTMMCAGELEGGKDTCQGDSGGPIQIARRNNQCVFSIVGITSFGKFCAAKNAPGVYTRVSSFVPWIESVVWSNS